MEDEVAALESVLAFIEAYDVAAIDSPGGGSEPLGDTVLPASRVASRMSAQESGKRQRGAADAEPTPSFEAREGGRPTSYTTMLQRRKRAEVHSLREQARELEAHLARLQGARWGTKSPKRANASLTAAPCASPSRSRASGASRTRLSDLWDVESTDGRDSRAFNPSLGAKSDSKWLDSVVKQYRLRRRSELKNRQLKQLMSQQMHLNTSILRLMQKRSLFPGLEQLLAAPTPESKLPGSVEYRIVDAEIESEITQLYREVDLVFDRAAVNDGSSISCSLETKHDPRVGDYAEVRTTTPMQRSASNAAMQVWRKTCSNPDQHLSFFSKTSVPDSYVKNFFLPLARRGEREGGDVVLNVWHHARKFDEDKRFVMVMYAIVQPPVSGMYLREDSWTLVSPSPTNPKHECVVQSYYRIHTKLGDSNARPTDEAADVCAFVMKALGRLTRRNMQTTQNWLLDEASSPFPDWVLT